MVREGPARGAHFLRRVFDSSGVFVDFKRSAGVVLRASHTFVISEREEKVLAHLADHCFHLAAVLSELEGVVEVVAHVAWRYFGDEMVGRDLSESELEVPIFDIIAPHGFSDFFLGNGWVGLGPAMD